MFVLSTRVESVFLMLPLEVYLVCIGTMRDSFPPPSFRTSALGKILIVANLINGTLLLWIGAACVHWVGSLIIFYLLVLLQGICGHLLFLSFGFTGWCQKGGWYASLLDEKYAIKKVVWFGKLYNFVRCVSPGEKETIGLLVSWNLYKHGEGFIFLCEWTSTLSSHPSFLDFVDILNFML